MLTITNDKIPAHIDVKRFYLPGVIIEGNCPKCNSVCSRDFEQEYISYPHINSPFSLTLYCCEDGCDGEFEINLILSFSLEEVKE